MARKDDPVFNVKFVQLVENQACLWNYTHPGYSKKEEVHRAWQHVANEIKDTVRNSRERWRTIRSSFLRSLKLARTQTGRGKRKYYLSKYLQFLIPYTKSRGCHKQQQQQQQQLSSAAAAAAASQATPNSSSFSAAGNPLAAAGGGGMVLRKPSTSTTTTTTTTAAAAFLPMTRIGQLRLLGQHSVAANAAASSLDEDTKDSAGSDCAAAEAQLLEVQVSEAEGEDEEEQDTAATAAETPLRLQAIKVEQQQEPNNNNNSSSKVASLVALPATISAALRNNMDWTELSEWLKGSSVSNQFQPFQHLHNSNSNNNNNNNSGSSNHNLLQHHVAAATPPLPVPAALAAGTGNTAPPPDADYSFLISLHPYLKEMSGKQNRRFRQKVVALIDNVLDNVDV